MAWYKLVKKRTKLAFVYGCWIGPNGDTYPVDMQEHGIVASTILGNLGSPCEPDVNKDPNALTCVPVLLGKGWARLITIVPTLELKSKPTPQQADAILNEFQKRSSGAKITVTMPGTNGKVTLAQLREIFNGRQPAPVQDMNKPDWFAHEWDNQDKSKFLSSKRLVKESATLETLPYFQEFADDGEYVPDIENVAAQLKQKFNATIVNPIGQGDSGVAYRLSNGDVLKVTTNDAEGRIAQWLYKNPHPNVARYKDVWKQGDLWYEVMEYVDTETPAKEDIQTMASLLDKRNCYDPGCAVKILMDPRYRTLPFIKEAISVLKHVSRIPGAKPFDLLNPNNVGESRGQLKFFDIT